MFTLYHSVICPFSRLIRLILSEKSMNFHLINEDYWNYDPVFSKINPAMEVPVLIEPEGKSIIGIYPILEYMFESGSDNKLFSNDIYEKTEIRRLVSWFNDKFHYEITKLIIDERIIRFYLSKGEPSSDILRVAKFNLNNHINYVEYLLKQRKWLSGENLSIVDFTAAAHFSILDYLGTLNWSQNNMLREWYSIIKSRPSFRDILQDRIIGFPPAKHYTNLDF